MASGSTNPTIDEIKKLLEQNKYSSKDIDALRRDIAEASTVLTKYTTVKGKLFGELQEDKARLNSLKDELNSAEKEFETAKKNLEATLSGIDSSLIDKNFTKEIENAIKKTKELENEIEEFGETVKTIGGDSAFEDFKKALSDANTKRDFTSLKANYSAIVKTVEDKLSLEKDVTVALQTQSKELTKAVSVESQAMRMRKQGWSDIKRGATEAFRIGKDFLDVWGKIDQAASKFAKSVGAGAVGMERLRKNAIESVQKGRFGAKYNVSADELIGMQETYANTIGRNIQISASDQENMAAMYRVMGETGGDFATKLENFGLSYTDAADKAGKMFKEASKYGISFEKYSKNVVNNIKLAQNYTFKNGIKGLESMAKKATAMKLDMQQVAAFADKVSTVEGAISTGAQLQVLGGPFAQFADPMGMMNEALTDMEGLQDRFEKMIGGLGRFDAQKGELAVSAFDKQRIKVAAEAMGMSYDQVMEATMAKGRQGFIGKQIANKGYSEEEQELLKNIATVQNGKATVSYVDKLGNKKEVNLAEQSLTKTELAMIKQQTQSESDDIKDIATTLRGWDDVMQGTKKQYENEKASIVERRGWGEKVKGIAEYVGESNKLLKMILLAVTAIGVGGAVLSMGRGVGSFVNGGGLRGMFKGVTGGAGGGTAAGTGTGAGAASGGGGLFGKIGKGTTKFGRSLIANGGRTGSTALSRTGSFIKNAGKSISKFGGAAAATGGILSGVLTGIDEFTGNKNYGTGKKIRRTAGSAIGAAIGAGLGTALGPIGTIVGGMAGEALGKWIGGGFANQKRRERKAGELGISGMLSGDYSVAELNKIANGSVIKGSKLEEKLKKNGDFEAAKDIQQIKEQQANIDRQVVTAQSVEITTDKNIATGKSNMANGGMLNGPSHAQGGMPILGSNIEVEGGEFVVNKRSAKKYQNTLNAINSMGDGGIIKPRKMTNGGSVIINQTGGNLGGQSFGAERVSVDPININVSGSIKLEGANGQKAELTADLLKNPQFISEITKLITKQMDINVRGAHAVNRPDA